MKAEHDEEIKKLKKGNELELNQLRIHYASEETVNNFSYQYFQSYPIAMYIGTFKSSSWC